MVAYDIQDVPKKAEEEPAKADFFERLERPLAWLAAITICIVFWTLVIDIALGR